MCELLTGVLILNPQRKSSLFEQIFVQIQCILQVPDEEGFSTDSIHCIPLVLKVVKRKGSHQIQQHWASYRCVIHIKGNEEKRLF